MDAEPWQSGTARRAWTTPDAVVVVPGIMGSELYDTRAKCTIWGLSPGLLVSMLLPGADGLARLAVDDDGHRVKPVGLLRFPAYLPGLGGLEPYSRLVRRLKEIVRHPDAVDVFPYDWRLPVAHNAKLLADKVEQHIVFWRRRSSRPDARVVLVAHSMGGLLCQAMTGISGAATDVRATITLGTPFDGAAKAVLILAEADGRLRRELAAVARTMPGVYDLLPSYRCVDKSDSVEQLTIDDVVALGGRRDLTEAAARHRAGRARLRLPSHRALIGVEQPTVSSLVLHGGIASASMDTFEPDTTGDLRRDTHGRLMRFPGRGDGTVPRNSASPYGFDPDVVAQQHTTLAHSEESITFVRDVILHGRATDHPRLGVNDVGLQLPDVVTPGAEWTAAITGIDPLLVDVTVTDIDTDTVIDRPPAHRRDNNVRVTSVVNRPGLYRVRINGGSSPVVQFVLALP